MKLKYRHWQERKTFKRIERRGDYIVGTGTCRKLYLGVLLTRYSIFIGSSVQ